MIRKFLKFGLAGTTAIAGTVLLFPDEFTPVYKVLNVGKAGV